MFSWTRTLVGSLGLCLVLSLFAIDDAGAVAAFTRQTGMSCNSCHTLHGAPTPNFTFTGRKFKALGYRLPGSPGHVQERSQDQGRPETFGEYLNLLPATLSGRFQYQVAQSSKSAATGDWGPVTTNPTSRFALFPYVGPIGNRFGVWTEIYIVPFTSEDGEWGIADTSYEEFDFRYILNPGNTTNIISLAMSNQSIYELYGFGPYPGLPSFIGRGGVGGYSHPNRAQLYIHGWMNDRWVWAFGAETGDTNIEWDKSNWLGLLGIAIGNRNDNEIWLNFVGRTGDDVLPLVSASGAQASSRSWQYRDAVGGISNTRRPAGTACVGLPGRRPAGSCSYLAEEVDDSTSFDVELRIGAQNVASLFGGNSKAAGSWSHETVARVTTNDESYIDGAEAKRTTWGLTTVLGWKHTYYIKPLISGDIDYEFTDRLGTKYDIDTKMTWNFTVAYKPVENFLIYAAYSNTQSNTLTGPAQSGGRSFQITADLSF